MLTKSLINPIRIPIKRYINLSNTLLNYSSYTSNIASGRGSKGGRSGRGISGTISNDINIGASSSTSGSIARITNTKVSP